MYFEKAENKQPAIKRKKKFFQLVLSIQYILYD